MSGGRRFSLTRSLTQVPGVHGAVVQAVTEVQQVVREIVGELGLGQPKPTTGGGLESNNVNGLVATVVWNSNATSTEPMWLRDPPGGGGNVWWP